MTWKVTVMPLKNGQIRIRTQAVAGNEFADKIGECIEKALLRRARKREPMTVKKLLQQVEREKFYGTISPKYSAGRLDLIRKEETIKPTVQSNF